MVFDMLLAFHINLINSKCYIQHTYAIFYFFINFSNTLWKKLLYIFLRVIDINERFNVRSTIGYYHAEHIKDNIYEGKTKGNYFLLVTLKTVHRNNREFRCYDITGTLDKQYVLVGNHSFVKSGQRIIFFNCTSAY